MPMSLLAAAPRLAPALQPPLRSVFRPVFPALTTFACVLAAWMLLPRFPTAVFLGMATPHNLSSISLPLCSPLTCYLVLTSLCALLQMNKPKGSVISAALMSGAVAFRQHRSRRRSQLPARPGVPSGCCFASSRVFATCCGLLAALHPQTMSGKNGTAVIVRVRPLNEREKVATAQASCLEVLDGQALLYTGREAPANNAFGFDAVLGQETTQAEAFEVRGTQGDRR
ncbi:hypothetical protein ABPG75_007969 [Micractinium tetrahymenae]